MIDVGIGACVVELDRDLASAISSKGARRIFPSLDRRGLKVLCDGFKVEDFRVPDGVRSFDEGGAVDGRMILEPSETCRGFLGVRDLDSAVPCLTLDQLSKGESEVDTF